MPNPPLFKVVNPFKHNPDLDSPEDNFVENAISSGIEKGIGNIGDKIVHFGQLKLEGILQNLSELATIALVCYYVYLGYKSMLKRDMLDLSRIFPVTMIYIIFRLVWKVVLHI
jgi:hypothetical protein